MERTQIFNEVKGIMEGIFDVNDLAVTEKSSAGDVEEWDSLNHIQLVVGIEKHFKIKFSSAEIQKWQNLGEICDSVSSKLAQ